MRVDFWDRTGLTKKITTVAYARIEKAAEVIKDAVRDECPVGTVSRPQYEMRRKGPLKGQPYNGEKPYTARTPGTLKNSIRVVKRDKEKYGFEVARFENLGHYGDVRVYAGHYMAYYAAIVEHSNPFMRRGLTKSRSKVKKILEDG